MIVKAEDWEVHVDKSVDALEKLDEAVREEYEFGSQMSDLQVAELRRKIEDLAYLVTMSIRPLCWIYPYWTSRRHEAKIVAFKEAKADVKSITEVKELYKGYKSYSSVAIICEIIEELISNAKASVIRASGVSNGMSYIARNVNYTTEQTKHDSQHDRGFNAW